jgi:diacylglycerol kinase
MRFVRNLLMAFVYAFAGIRYVMRQRNPRIHLLAAICVIALAAWLKVSRGEWAVLVLCIGLVKAAESINSAIEATVDLLSPDVRPSAKIAKDAAAGAVLIAAIAAAMVGFIVLGPPLRARLFGI